MDKNTKDVVTAWTKSGVIGKILITFMIIFVIGFVWDKIDNREIMNEYVRQGDNIEKLVENQVEIDTFKKCLADAHTDLVNEFNNNMLAVLGKTLQKSNVTFPQELNESIMKLRAEMENVKDCLIFPGE